MNSSVTHTIPCNKVKEVGKTLDAQYGPQDVLHCYEGHFFLIKKNDKTQMIVDVQYEVAQIVMDIKTGKKTSNSDKQLIAFFKNNVHKMNINVIITDIK
jgi:hypothetical protein